MELAISILGLILGLFATGLSIYNTIVLKVDQLSRGVRADVPTWQGRENAREIAKGENQLIQPFPDDGGMPQVYDPEEEADFEVES